MALYMAGDGNGMNENLFYTSSSAELASSNLAHSHSNRISCIKQQLVVIFILITFGQ